MSHYGESSVRSFRRLDNEKTFTRILFSGEENSLFIWNLITYLWIDSLATNFVLAAVITYVVNRVSGRRFGARMIDCLV